MTEEPEEQLEEMEQQREEVDRDIEGAEQQWERTKKDVPTVDDDDALTKPVDEDNPVGGI